MRARLEGHRNGPGLDPPTSASLAAEALHAFSSWECLSTCHLLAVRANLGYSRRWSEEPFFKLKTLCPTLLPPNRTSPSPLTLPRVQGVVLAP